MTASEQDTTRFVKELSYEFEHALDLVKTRLTVSSDTFSTVQIIGTLHVIALEYALKNGISAPDFIAAMRAVASKLEFDLKAKSGFFANRA